MLINGATELYGIIGNPVSHSLSPAMHNAAFAELGLNKVYVPFTVEDVNAALPGLAALGVRGVSVTIPHKQTIIPLIDDLDPVAARIGAVNTLVIDNGRIAGSNTDWLGANTALSRLTELTDCRVLLLGAGGAARAVGFGLKEAGADLTLASRTPAAGRELSAALDCPWLPLSEAAEFKGTVLINATSVGMRPLDEDTPLPAAGLSAFDIVMDIVYSPLETRLLREAAQAGCRTINGLSMLLFQGAAQFELWTGEQAPIAVMRRELENKIR